MASNSWRNYYATLWKDSRDSAQYALSNWDRLFRETASFKEALFSSTLPTAVVDAISANLSVLKSPTVLRLQDGTFYGFEGCHPDEMCCEGSCTHVWNYAYALPFLFPRLERSMREADYRHNLRDDGGMSFRILLPLGRGRSSFRPCADGQFGGIVKVYRDWKISGDTDWIARLWPAVKQSLAFAWSPQNDDRWDRDKAGVLEGRQHHTSTRSCSAQARGSPGSTWQPSRPPRRWRSTWETAARKSSTAPCSGAGNGRWTRICSTASTTTSSSI